MEIRSSWWVINGDVMKVGSRRANGKKMVPRNKRGPKLTAASQLRSQKKIEAAKERRRAGLHAGRRDP